MDRKSVARYLLTAALVLVFGWFGVDKFLNGFVWVGFLPLWMDGFLSMAKTTWIVIMGVIEVTLAVMLLIPVRRIRQLGALLIAIHLVGVVAQVGWNDVGIRDIGLLLSSLALFALL
jgi:TM2 domain-containing membrane protein YozV